MNNHLVAQIIVNDRIATLHRQAADERRARAGRHPTPRPAWRERLTRAVRGRTGDTRGTVTDAARS